MGTLYWKHTATWGYPCNGLAPHPGVVAILVVASCYRNQVKLWPYKTHRLIVQLYLPIHVPIAWNLFSTVLASCSMFTTAVKIQGEFEPWKDEGYLQKSYY